MTTAGTDSPALRISSFSVLRNTTTVVTVQDAFFGVGSHVIAGANGAGKSSLVAGLAGLLRSTGLADFGGVDVRSSSGRRLVGYMPQQPTGLDHMTVESGITYAQSITDRDRPGIGGIISKVGLEGCESTRIRHLSGGQRRLAYLAMVLAQTPKVLLLDEPTTGLDATHRLKIREIIRGLSESTCVITTSHSPDDLDSLADHLIVFKDGESVFDGPGLQFLRSPDAEQARSWDTALAKVEEAEE